MDKPLVYVVDDDDFIREALADVLAESGYDVHSYRNGLEAANALEASETPNLILLDWMMPTMSGADFIRRESVRIEEREIPVVVVSAVADRIGDIAGVQEKMMKPVGLSDLLSTVSRHYRREPDQANPQAS